MRWGSSRKRHGLTELATEQGGETCEREGKGKGKGKASFPSLSPLSWLVAKLAGGKPRAAAMAGGGAAPAVPSTCPATTAITPGLPRSQRRSPAAGVDVVPRRLSVGNDSAASAAVRHRHRVRRRRHCSVGGERDPSQPLGQLIAFSVAGTPPPPSGTGTGKRRRRLSGRRSSFSGRAMPLIRVRVRRAAELESLAVVRRTRDPQRAFRESMSEMIVVTGAGGARPEELLACYLALNADEHHGCIVKVFRQVWFDHVSNNLLTAAAASPKGARSAIQPASILNRWGSAQW
ncbi:transcription repressor OFP1 [Brachypodium distachyon]|uniref:Transcription repressor n=1 Tax=Brachypodium distachyon TaxID=15368 RepID=I1HHK4_BRADI|nr:transcription repressor OFP1 [Brachypodium distachyon]PNT70917.1 hypothetical protein BRADI_2g19720v3 [Brachypodium distachyon]|eukprot:XP_014754380.1 transcription repressor OFP1 [Brachypodium distachyon]